MQRIRETTFLSDNEEYITAKAWQEKQDPKALDRLVKSHLKLVIKVAKGYNGYGLPLEELVAEGNVGILQATKKFDPEKGFKFSTYAQWWIKASIQEYILNSWSMVKLGTTRTQKKLFFNLRKLKNKLDKEKKDDFLSDEKIEKIAQELNVTKDEVTNMHQRLTSKDTSLNVPVKSADDGSGDWIEWVSDDAESHEDKIFDQNEFKKRQILFEKAFKILKAKEQYIFSARRLSDKTKTLEELAEEMNLSRERIRQIEKIAFDKIRQYISKISDENDIHL